MFLTSSKSAGRTCGIVWIQFMVIYECIQCLNCSVLLCDLWVFRFFWDIQISKVKKIDFLLKLLYICKGVGWCLNHALFPLCFLHSSPYMKEIVILRSLTNLPHVWSLDCRRRIVFFTVSECFIVCLFNVVRQFSHCDVNVCHLTAVTTHSVVQLSQATFQGGRTIKFVCLISSLVGV